MAKDFLKTSDWTREELEGLLDAALRFKRGEDAGRPLAGRSVALVFFNPSLRTRASMQVGIYELGGNAVVLEPGGTSWTLEHRARVPVINLESAMHHPCQALADMLTIREKLGAGRKRVLLTWAWHPKPLPMAVPNSFALAAAQVGHDLTIAHPPGYELDEDLIREINARAFDAGATVRVTDDVDAAFDGAQIVYAKSWGSRMFYGAPQDDIEERARYRA